MDVELKIRLRRTLKIRAALRIHGHSLTICDRQVVKAMIHNWQRQSNAQ